MLFRNIFAFITISLFEIILLQEEVMVEIDGIEPNAGPLYGETRVLVRLKNLNEKYVNLFPLPKCKFGTKKLIVDATWVKCISQPRIIGGKEIQLQERNQTCVQCEFSPPKATEDIVPLTISLLGDFTDIKNSMPFRYYKEPTIKWIYPRYGTKDGNTFVEVFGENFLNFDQNLRCGFGNQEVKAIYVNRNYLICYSPPSDIVEKRMPFSISFNNQQNTKQEIDYIYFNWAQVASLSPNRGPDTGGTIVRIKGQNFDPSNRTSFHNFNDTFCRFGNLSIAVAQVVSSTEMICTSPPSFELREVPVEVTLNNREWTNDGILFYYYRPPFVYSIFPKIGNVDGGTVVTVTGSNFVNTGVVLCKFGSIPTRGEYINENTLKCTSPKVEKPGYVNLAIAIREDEFSSGSGTRYLYFDTPIIYGISPICGPERGFTQITIQGKNFADTGSDYMKCVFDGRIFMNATRMSDSEIKCDSPSVLNYGGVNENNIRYYNIMISLNGYDSYGPSQRFNYYKETYISGIEPIYGPTTGGTIVKINGGDFAQDGACNVTVRFSNYMIKPINYTNSTIYVTSPESNFTGAVVVQVALNGRQFDKDIQINFRDKENTFYYYKPPFITMMKPVRGPTIGGTRLVVFGMNFDSIYHNEPNIENHVIYYRFVHYSSKGAKNPQPIGNAFYKTILYSKNFINLVTPPSHRNNTIAAIELSYNQQNFFLIEEYNFTYFVLANITKISPQYGPLQSKDSLQIELLFDNYYCVENCDRIICRFTSKTNIFFEKGKYIGPNKVNCSVPRISTPDVFTLEVSFNAGEEFTNNKKNFTFYDPFILKINPQMVSSSGNTTIYIAGYGFADTGDNLKVKFGSPGRPLKCDMGSCIVKAQYVNENLIIAKSFSKDLITYLDSGKSIQNDRIAIEVSLYNDDFTSTNMTFFYFDDIEIIPDVLGSNKLNLTTKEKEIISQSLIYSLPANIETFIVIPVYTGKIIDNLKNIEPLSRYSCKFENANKTISKVTDGLLTSYPKNLDKKNIFLCQSPKWDEVGEFNIMISLNRYDFSNSVWKIIFTDPIHVLRVDPPCGPVQGKTKMKLYGTGFEKSSDFVFKFGVQNVIPMSNANLWEQVKESEISHVYQSKFKIHKVEIEVPTAPYYLSTYGGLDYVSVAKLTTFPLADFVSNYNPSSFIHSNLEYYYYKPQYIQSFSPKGSIITGGTDILVVGAWFGYKPEYGYRPYCRFGEKIVEGQWLSTVRISCISPPYSKANIKVPFDVSMNKNDFTSSGLTFTYYSDFTKAKFDLIEPTSGPNIGGTMLKLYGQNFTSLLNPDEFLCKFKSDNDKMESKNVPAIFKEYSDGKTAIICSTPGGWASGTIASIYITFDGQKFIDTNFDFYFYKIDKVVPLSGPNTGNGPIQILGGGFQNSTKVKCILGKVVRKPVFITEKIIGCQMVSTPNSNFTGLVEFQMSLNGIDRKEFQGFYYYVQPNITSIFPSSGPSSGNALVKVFGSGFRKDFPGVNLGCKIGNYFGRGEYVSEKELFCFFNKLPLLDKNQTFNFSVAMNNYSFTNEITGLNFTPYGIISIEPSSGPISGGTDILVKGAGFYDSKNIRCSFGVRGYYQYTFAKYIDYNHIVCISPENFILPVAGQLPFSVPFSIAMNDDLYNPWTESTHIYSFYENPEINTVSPSQAKTTETKEIFITATMDKPFATPSATISEQNIVDYSKEKKIIIKKSFAYQPIKCRFGRFGTSSGIYVNRTLIKCITPKIEDDSDISFEDVSVGIALNGVDFIENSDAVFTFQGPNSGRMMWVYILITLFIALLIGLIVYLISSYWDKIQSSLDTGRRDVYSSDLPHVIQKQPRYLNPEYRNDIMRPPQDQNQQPNFNASNLIK